MRTATMLASSAVVLLAAGAAVGAMMWPRPDVPADPADWPVEQLVADPTVELPYPLHTDLASCPQFSMSSAAPPYARDIPGDDTYTVQLDAQHYTLWVCLGTAEEVGARRSVADYLGVQDLEVGTGRMWNQNATRVDAPFGEMYRVDRTFGEGSPPRLTDWLVDHDGYTYAFGYLHPVDDARWFDEVEAMIASITFEEVTEPVA